MALIEIMGRTYELPAGITIIGRGDEADIRIDSARLSRAHARFTVNGGEVAIEDLGSRNGVFINGQRIESRRSVKSSDILKLADIVCTLSVPAPMTTEPAAASTAARPRRRRTTAAGKAAVLFILAIALLAGYSYIKGYVPQARLDARALLTETEACLNTFSDPADLDSAAAGLQELRGFRTRLEGIPAVYSDESRRAHEQIAAIEKLLSRLEKLGRIRETEEQAGRLLTSIRQRIEAGTLAIPEGIIQLNALQNQYPETGAGSAALALAGKLDQKLLAEERAIIAEACFRASARAEAAAYTEALQILNTCEAQTFARVDENDRACIRTERAGIINRARQALEALVNEAVAAAHTGDCRVQETRVRAAAAAVGLPGLQPIMDDALARIKTIRQDRITRARAMIAAELEALEKLETRRMYTQAQVRYAVLIGEITETELRAELAGREEKSRLLTALKTAMITFVNNRQGVELPGTGHIARLTDVSVELVMDGMGMEVTWDKIRDSEFLVLALQAGAEQSTPLLQCALACLLAAAGREEEADRLLTAARQAQPALADGFPLLFRAGDERIAARQAARAAAVRPGKTGAPEIFAETWVHTSEHSAAVYWHLDRMDREAYSYVAYGPTPACGQRTPLTRDTRWAHLHHLSGLQPATGYCYRMVIVENGTETSSEVRTLATRRIEGAVRIPDALGGRPPYNLNSRSYVLTADIEAPETAFVITGSDVTLDLNGHTVTFGMDTDRKAAGVLFSGGAAVLINGRIVQGARSGGYSAAIESSARTGRTEIAGITTDVHGYCAYPAKFLNRTTNFEMHHNHLYSRVTEIENRHYPGNHLLKLDGIAGGVNVHHNLLTEGCHIGIGLTGGAGIPFPAAAIHHNDIRHHQQYVNGYAIMAHCERADIHHNRITSTGRCVHITAPEVVYRNNYGDTRGHFHRDDMPAGSRPFQHRRVELHGIKFEGDEAVRAKVYGNFMRITQVQPVDMGGEGDPADKIVNGVYLHGTATALTADRLTDETRDWENQRWRGYRVRYAPGLPPVEITASDRTSLTAAFRTTPAGAYTIYFPWDYVPATPLNLACYNPDAMNEIYNNTIVALTTYKQTRHGGYGESGQWASSIYCVDMTHGPAPEGRYTAWIHDNTFISNDLFLSAGAAVTMTFRITNNRFLLAPDPTGSHTPYRGIGPALERSVREGDNVFGTYIPGRENLYTYQPDE